MSDPYSILGVDRNATDEDVKKGLSKAEQTISSGCEYQ